jgi:hypothetical protein
MYLVKKKAIQCATIRTVITNSAYTATGHISWNTTVCENVRVRDLKQAIREMLEELKFELDGQKIAKILNRRLMELELGKF